MLFGLREDFKKKNTIDVIELVPMKSNLEKPKEGKCEICKRHVKNLQSHMRVRHLFTLIKKRGHNLRKREYFFCYSSCKL